MMAKTVLSVLPVPLALKEEPVQRDRKDFRVTMAKMVQLVLREERVRQGRKGYKAFKVP